MFQIIFNCCHRKVKVYGREFHRRGRWLKYKCLEVLDVALECLSLRNVSRRVLDELKQTKLEMFWKGRKTCWKRRESKGVLQILETVGNIYTSYSFGKCMDISYTFLKIIPDKTRSCWTKLVPWPV